MPWLGHRRLFALAAQVPCRLNERAYIEQAPKRHDLPTEGHLTGLSVFNICKLLWDKYKKMSNSMWQFPC